MGRKSTQYVKSVISAGDRVEIELDVQEVIIGIDLPNELLLFDPEKGVGVKEGTSKESIRARIDSLQLLKDLLSNGSLEVRSAETDKPLERTDPYIATNIDLRRSISNIDRSIKQLETQLRETAEVEPFPG
jgi:hypothetical protein